MQRIIVLQETAACVIATFFMSASWFLILTGCLLYWRMRNSLFFRHRWADSTHALAVYSRPQEAYDSLKLQPDTDRLWLQPYAKVNSHGFFFYFFETAPWTTCSDNFLYKSFDSLSEGRLTQRHDTKQKGSRTSHKLPWTIQCIAYCLNGDDSNYDATGVISCWFWCEKIACECFC